MFSSITSHPNKSNRNTKLKTNLKIWRSERCIKDGGDFISSNLQRPRIQQRRILGPWQTRKKYAATILSCL